MNLLWWCFLIYHIYKYLKFASLERFPVYIVWFQKISIPPMEDHRNSKG